MKNEDREILKVGSRVGHHITNCLVLQPLIVSVFVFCRGLFFLLSMLGTRPSDVQSKFLYLLHITITLPASYMHQISLFFLFEPCESFLINTQF